MASGAAKRKACGGTGGTLDTSPVAARGGHGFLPRWVLLVLALLLVPGIMAAVAGPYSGAVFGTWVYAAFTLPVLVAAWMLGMLLTRPFTGGGGGCFGGSPWPDAYRSLVAVGLGLGIFSLGTLLMGTLHLVEPGGGGGQLWPLAMLPLAGAAAGYSSARDFLRKLDRGILTRRVHRGEWLLLLGAVPVALLLVAATFPPGTLWVSEGHGYDVLEYHLELPREYAAANSTAPLGHNVYSYLPANVEMLYLLLMQTVKWGMQWPSPLWGIFPAQFLHAALLILTAMGVALIPGRGLSATARALAVVVFLAIPWTIVTGSLAYNEGGMMLFGVLALGSAVGGGSGEGGAGGQGWREAGLMGVLLGLAVGSKMTAGVFFAVPVAMVVALGSRVSLVRRFAQVAAIAGVAVLVYLPWAVRAAVYSGGNPVFPIASSWLGRGGWTAEQSARFERGHAAPEAERSLAGRLGALAHEWVLDEQWSPGWDSIYRWTSEAPPQPGDSWAGRALAVLKQVGVLWLVLPLAVVLALLRAGPMRVLALYLLAVFAIQVLAWLYGTHLQARFLLPATVPLALLLGMGGGEAAAEKGKGRIREGPAVNVLRVIVCTAVALHALASVFVLLPEAHLPELTGLAKGGRPAAQWIGEPFAIELNVAGAVEHPKGLPGGAEAPAGKILLVGDSTAFRFAGKVVYNTVFDRNLLGDALRHGGPEGAVAWLRREKINYVYIDWNEVRRLRGTYGFDEAITEEAVAGLVKAGLKPVEVPLANGVTVLQVSAVDTAAASRGAAAR